MSISKFDSRQMKNRAALSTSIGSSANATLDTIFGQIDSVMVNLSGTQTLSAKTLAFLKTNVITDSTTTGSAATLQAGDIADGTVRLTNASLVSVSGIPAGASGQVIAISNQSGNTITINNDDSGATAANRIYTGTGGSVSMTNNSTFLLNYDTTASRWMVMGGTGSGSGGGGSKNYLSAITASTSSGVPNTGNGDFEQGSTTGWSLAHSTLTSLIPTSTATAGTAFDSTHGGSAASGNLSIGVVSSGQLAGSTSGSLVSSAASTAGDLLISNAFFIDKEDQAKMLSGSFSYLAQSGASNMNFSGSSSNTHAVYIYDVDNASWIQPGGVYNLVQSSGVGECNFEFQTSASGTKYQVALVNVNASAGAFTLYLDSFKVGPQISVQGPAVSDWQSYTPTISAGFGTTTNVSFFYRRSGDKLEVRGTFTAGTTAASLGTFSLPSGLSIDTLKQPLNNTSANPGPVVGQLSGTAANNAGSIVTATGTSTTLVYYAANYNATNILTPGNVSSSLTGGVTMAVNFSLPITGWSSNTVMSNDTDTRVVAALISGLPTGTLTSSDNVVKYHTIESDTHGGYNATTGLYTVPVSGAYDISAQINFIGTFGAGTANYILIYKNGSLYHSGGHISSGTSDDPAIVPIAINAVPLIAGDTIGIYVNTSATGASYSATSNRNYFSISRRSGPAVIAASESVAAEYTTLNSFSALDSTETLISYSTKVYDTHGSYNTSTGGFTAPISGKYTFTMQIQWASSLIGTKFMKLYINGVSTNITFKATTAQDQFLAGSVDYNLNAGDVATFKVFQNSGGTVANGGNGTYHFYSVKKIGN